LTLSGVAKIIAAVMEFFEQNLLGGMGAVRNS
jgi:hypothetical protein